MKKQFTEEPVLLMPDQSKPFQIESDASKVATGAVLTQLDLNGDRHPIAFLSKTFSETERKYEIYDWELLGIIRALKEWRHSSKDQDTQQLFIPTTRTWRIFEWHKSWMIDKPDGHYTCQGLT
jgi:hypothetical protein